MKNELRYPFVDIFSNTILFHTFIHTNTIYNQGGYVSAIRGDPDSLLGCIAYVISFYNSYTRTKLCIFPCSQDKQWIFFSARLENGK